ncbi:MAG: M50 family metallopeptidase [Chitinophagaceae bacterium]|nr:M50 family metallopeptidase [Chitinophagaceae bacterium]
MEKGEMIPEINEDVKISQFSENTYLVHQTQYNHRLKVSSEVYLLLLMIDGKRNISFLTKKYEKDVSIDFIYELLFDKLGSFGIIKNSLAKIKKDSNPSYLKLSFIFINKRIISKIIPPLKFLFNPASFLISFILFLTISFIVFLKCRQLLISYNFNGDIVLFLVLGFISITFHELGHVTAAEYFGAEQNGIGGGFYLLSPVYFADISDIWKLPYKQRIIVNIAGVYFEMIICTIFLLISILIDRIGIAIIVYGIFLKALFNLLPFIRSDGYWILVDFLNIPNLHQQANRTLKELVQSIYKRKLFAFTKLNILLCIYALGNICTALFFIFYATFYHLNSIIYLPINFYHFMIDLHHNVKYLSLENLKNFFIPVLFYFMLFNFLKSNITGRIYRRNRVK